MNNTQKNDEIYFDSYRDMSTYYKTEFNLNLKSENNIIHLKQIKNEYYLYINLITKKQEIALNELTKKLFINIIKSHLKIMLFIEEDVDILEIPEIKTRIQILEQSKSYFEIINFFKQYIEQLLEIKDIDETFLAHIITFHKVINISYSNFLVDENQKLKTFKNHQIDEWHHINISRQIDFLLDKITEMGLKDEFIKFTNSYEKNSDLVKRIQD